jgi:hypothetical protein
MSETHFFGKITPLESCFVHHSFCLVLFKSRSVRARFFPFSETQIFANLIPFKSRFVHCSFCLVPFKSRTILPRSSLFRLKMIEIKGAFTLANFTRDFAISLHVLQKNFLSLLNVQA